MITLNTQLQKVMASQNLEGLRPFAYLYRNKWNSTNNKYELENTAIDISSMIVKPNTLSMTLDVNEIAQFNANNITLTLTDYENKFIEGTPNSFFPSGYQLYGSRVVLYYGTSTADMTSLFVGAIKDLPTHKPEQYQVDLKLISPLELLNDIEAKDFSNTYTGETLTPYGTDSSNNPIYRTANNRVGGFSAVYGNGIKLFEGVDYEVSQINNLSLPALITIINSSHTSDTITADYYCWKTGLSVEDIVSGLVALGGYTNNTDIRSVVWNTEVSSEYNCSVLGSFVFREDNGKFKAFTSIAEGNTWNGMGIYLGNFKIDFNCSGFFALSDNLLSANNSSINNGIKITPDSLLHWVAVQFYVNGTLAETYNATSQQNFSIARQGNTFTISSGEPATTYTATYNFNFNYLYLKNGGPSALTITLRDSNNNDVYTTEAFGQGSISGGLTIQNTIITDSINLSDTTLKNFNATIENTSGFSMSYYYRTADTYNNWGAWETLALGSDIGADGSYFQFKIAVNSLFTAVQNVEVYNMSANFLSTSLTLNMVNLGTSSVLEALQDLALISGYEFGVDRQGTFFFRPRSQSTTPIFELDETQIVKIENIRQNFNDFFTKLTLQFGQRPFEFYANTGTRPTPVDKYGIINKEIDKPDIVNYDNPELAQAIGPQLLEVYSDLSDVIQCTAKLNLSLELGDIVNLKRNYNLTCDDNANDYTKFINQNTYYRACKITGINYNLSKRQMTYTLRDVSNSNNEPFNPDSESES